MKRSNWIELVFLPPAVMVLNTAWIWLWMVWSVRAVPPLVIAAPFSPLVLGLVLLGGFAVTRWALAGSHPSVDPRLAVTLAGLVFVFGAVWLTYAYIGPLGVLRELVDWGNFISPVFLGLLACAFLWLQGIQLGRSALPQENLERAFYGGLVALGLVFAVNQLRPLFSPAEALTAALAFFATGLAGLAVVSLENARRAELGLTGTWPALNRYWLGTIASVIGSILLAGLLLAGLLSPQTFAQIANTANVVVDAVTLGVVIVAGFLTFVVAWLLAPILMLLARAAGVISLHLPALPNFQQANQKTLEFFARYPILNFVRRGLVLGLIICVLVLLFWWAVRRFTRRPGHDTDETRENIATRDLLLAQLRHWLHHWGNPAPPRPAFLSLSGGSDDPRLIVRRAYQALLAAAPDLSLPVRRTGETPAAYAEVLRRALPGSGPAIETLTGAYVLARYAADGPSMDVARAAVGAVAQLRQLALQLKQAPRRT